GPCPGTLPPGVAGCTLADFKGGFAITSSTPLAAIAGNTAAGTPTATLANGTLRGVELTIDCAQTALFGARVRGVSITGVLPDGFVGQIYTGGMLTLAGGTAPYQVNVVPMTGSLPPGITITGNQLSGTPTVEGAFTFYLAATDSSQPAKASLPTP